MPELQLQLTGDILTIRLGEHTASIPFIDVALNEHSGQQIYDDAAVYGRTLFAKTFRDEQMQAVLTNIRANERLVLVADDPLVAAIPWEYLRDQRDKLLASRLNFVRSVSEPEALTRNCLTLFRITPWLSSAQPPTGAAIGGTTLSIYAIRLRRMAPATW